MDPVNTDFHFSSLQQLRSNLREMEKLCGRVCSADAEDLEKLVQPIRERASAAIQEFLRIHSDAINRPDVPTISTHETISTLHSMCFWVCLCCMKLFNMCFYCYNSLQAFSLSCDGLGDGDTGLPGSPVTQTQLLLPEIPPEQNAAESWDSLAEVIHTNTYRHINIFEYKDFKCVWLLWFVCLGPTGAEWFSKWVRHSCSCKYHTSMEMIHSLLIWKERKKRDVWYVCW